MAVRAVRGAIQVDADERDEILQGTTELVTEVLAAQRDRPGRPDQHRVHRDPRPDRGVPGLRRPAARPDRRPAAVHDRDRGAGGDAPRAAADGARRDRPGRAPRSATSTCAGRPRCAPICPSDPRVRILDLCIPSDGRPRAPFTGVVALDGPSGTGKSTVARRLAQRLAARYLDTGAMYRAATVAALRAGVDLDDPVAITARRRAAPRSRSRPIPTAVSVRARRRAGGRADPHGRDHRAVSAVSAVPAVRAQLVAAQRELIGDGGIVVEGRDIGSVVWPTARPKVYLTASAEARAARRAGELHADVAASRPTSPGATAWTAAGPPAR